MIDRPTHDLPALTVVVPTLDAAATLPATLGAVAEAGCPVIVVDGGSRDGTADIARECGAEAIGAPTGRGPQLAAGAAVAETDWLFFLHADSVPRAGWSAAAADFMADAENRARAGYFRLVFDRPGHGLRMLARYVGWRSRLGLPYGDQGLLIPRAFYERIGGYAPIPLMEDVELAGRLGRRRLVAIDHDIVTSAARYRSGGVIGRGARNLALLALYTLGVPPTRLARWYG